jgi:predicted transcriptional regulator
MKKAILISIRPEWVKKILNGKKTVEIRKTAPKLEYEQVEKEQSGFKDGLFPFIEPSAKPIDCYIYCSITGFPLIALHLNNKKWHILCDVNGNPYKGNSDYKYQNGKIVAKFTLKKTEELIYTDRLMRFYTNQDGLCARTDDEPCEPFYNGLVGTVKGACLSQQQLLEYGKGKPLFAWHISDLVVFDKPMELGEACGRKILTRPPQSWHYVEAVK